jgi:hypothetical protein
MKSFRNRFRYTRLFKNLIHNPYVFLTVACYTCIGAKLGMA